MKIAIFYLFLAIGLGIMAGALAGFIIRSIRKGRVVTFPQQFFNVGLLFAAASFTMFILSANDETGIPFQPIWNPTALLVIGCILAVTVAVLVNHHTAIFHDKKRII